MTLDDSAVRLMDMRVYSYQSELLKISIWIAETNDRQHVTTDDVMEAEKVIRESGVPKEASE